MDNKDTLNTGIFKRFIAIMMIMLLVFNGIGFASPSVTFAEKDEPKKEEKKEKDTENDKSKDKKEDMDKENDKDKDDDKDSDSDDKDNDSKDGDDDKKEDSDEGGSNASVDKGSDNVFEGLDDARKEMILQRVSYDQRMQYIVTYSILSDEYLGEGAYTNLVNNGKFPEGMESDIEMGKFKTGASNIAITSKQSEDEEDSKENKEEAKESVEKGGDKNEVISKIVEKNVDNFTVSFFAINEISPKYSSFMGNKLTVNYSVPTNSTATKKNLEKEKYYGELKSLMETKMTNYLKSIKFDELPKDTELRDDLFKKVYPTHDEYTSIMTKLHSTYFSGDVDMGKITQGYNSPEKSLQGGMGGAVGMSNTSVVINKYGKQRGGESLKYIKYVPIKFSIFRSTTKDRDKISQQDFFNYMYTKDNGVKSKVDGVTKSILGSKEFKELNSIASEESELVGEDDGTVKGIGWLPTHLKYGNGVEKNTVIKDTDFQDVIKYFDGGVISTEGTVQISNRESYKGFRLLQLNDIINIPVKKSKTGEKTKDKVASPYLSYKFDEWLKPEVKKNAETRLTLNYHDLNFNPDIVNYTGIRMSNEKEVNDEKGLIHKIMSSKKDKIGFTHGVDMSGVKALDLATHKTFSYVNRNGEKIIDFSKIGDMTVGVDNYGNLISSENMRVIIPYWLNTNIVGMEAVQSNGGKQFLSNPASKKLNDTEKGEILSSKISKSELDVSLSAEKLADIGKFPDIAKFNAVLSQNSENRSSFDTYIQMMGEGTSKQALALAITQETSDIVKGFNANFLQQAKEHGELYITPSNAGAGDETSDEDDLDKFNALELLEKIKEMLDIGFYEVIRLTIASWVVDFYTGNVSNFSLSNIFHTKVVADTPFWSEIQSSILLLILGFTVLYFSAMIIKILRGTRTGKDLAKKIGYLIVLPMIPILIYAPMVHWTQNVPSQKLIHKQMEQVSLVDAYVNEQMEFAETDPLYDKLFGHTAETRSEERREDYIVEFYTTEHVKGFDIKDYDPSEHENIFSKFIKSDSHLNKDVQWSKSDLVKVNVSVFDLIEWAREDNGDLFQWLASNKSDSYEGIVDYTEYSVDTSLAFESLDFDYVGREWKASEVFRELFVNMEEHEVQSNISGLYNLTKAFRTRKAKDDSDGLSDTEREMLVRDLAFAGSIREELYETRDNVSDLTKNIFDKYSIDKEVINLENDFLALEHLVPEFIPYRNITTTTLEGDVFDINKSVINDYILNLSLVRESSNESDEETYARAEYPMIVMTTWFEFNKLINNKFYPTNFSVESLTFDSYMRLVYLPIGVYFDVDSPEVQNVAEYLSLRTHPGTLLFLFIPLILALILFGLVYTGMFYVGLMVMMMGAFIYNNFIKENPHNKAWLGVLYILLTFGLIKFFLTLIWKLLSLMLNYTYITSGGAVSTPYVLINTSILLAYVVFSLYIIFKFVILNIIKDKANLGGEAMHESAKGFVSKAVATLKGGGIKGGVNKLSGGVKGAFDVTKGREGAKATLGALNKGAVGMASIANKGLRKAIVNKRTQGIANSIGDTITSYYNKAKTEFTGTQGIYKTTNAKGEVQELDKNVTNKLMEGTAKDTGFKMAKGVFRAYDKVVPLREQGLDVEGRQILEENGDYGKNIDSKDDDLTVITTSNHESAKIVQQYLKETMGVESAVVGDENNQVMFKKGNYNLSTSSGRKSLYGGLIQENASYLQNATTITKDEVSADDNSVLDYFESKDGHFVLNVGKSGIHNQNLGDILESKQLHENYHVITEPELKGDGTYANGKLVLLPKVFDKDKNYHADMDNIFSLDNSLRQQSNFEDRSQKTYNRSVDMNNVENVDRFTDGMKELGMSMQNGIVYYDKRNKRQEKFVKEMMNTVNNEIKESTDNRKDLSVQLASHVVGGEGHGIETKVVTKEEVARDTELLNKSQQNGLDVFAPQTANTFFGGKHSEKIANVLNDSIAYNSIDSKVAKEFTSSQKDVHKVGEKLIENLALTKDVKKLGQSAKDKAIINKIVGVAEKSKLDKQLIGTIKDKQRNLEIDRKSNKITESEYQSGLKNLKKEAKDILKSDSKYTNMMTDLLRNSMSHGKLSGRTTKDIQSTLDRFVDSSKKVNDLGFEDIGTSAQLYEDLNLDKHGIDLTKIKSVDVSSDGKIHVKTDGTIDKNALDNFVSELSQNVATINEKHQSGKVDTQSKKSNKNREGSKGKKK